ncbi:MAG: PIN domain-containing protein [Cyanobacteria bacterium J06621_15]
MIIAYIDSGVLLSATDGVGSVAEKALEVLGDSNRQFASSEFVKLEVIPKAVYHKQTEEVEFYEEFFNAVTYWANDLEKVIQDAHNIGCQYGLAAMDALHIAAALSINAEEFITTEKTTKPMFRVPDIQVISIFN